MFRTESGQSNYETASVMGQNIKLTSCRLSMMITNGVCNKQVLCVKENNFNISALFFVLLRKLCKLKDFGLYDPFRNYIDPSCSRASQISFSRKFIK